MWMSLGILKMPNEYLVTSDSLSQQAWGIVEKADKIIDFTPPSAIDKNEDKKRN